MLSSIPGIENLSPAVKYVIAFAIIFVLLAIFALVLRRLTGGRLSLANERGRARQPRLGIVDVYDLDRQRQLILLRRDNVEHLLLVGGPNDVVVETNIMRVPGARLPAAVADTFESAAENGTARPVIEPALGRLPERMAEPVVAGRLNPIETATATPPASLAGRGAPEPALRPTSAPAPRPIDRGREPVRSSASGGSALRSPGGPVPPSNDMARQLEEALRGAPAPNPVPPLAEKPVRAAPPPPRAPEPTKAPEPKPVPPAPPPPAISKPEAAPRPEPKPEPTREPAKVEPPKAAQGPRPLPDNRTASEPKAPAEASKPAPDAVKPPVEPPKPVPPVPPRPEPAPPARPAPPAASPPAPPEPARPAADAKPAAPQPAPEPPAKSSSDPFSIEDIEAEFARLLGRPLDRKEDRS